MRRRGAGHPVLRVDPVACDGIGLCAQLAGAVVDLDRWGFPVLAADLPPRDVRAARRAVAACPRHALWIQEPDPAELPPSARPGTVPTPRPEAGLH